MKKVWREMNKSKYTEAQIAFALGQSSMAPARAIHPTNMHKSRPEQVGSYAIL